MSDPSETGEKLFDEKERKRLVDELIRIKDVLDSFKYGLEFEKFADALFKTIDRQTITIKRLDDRMAEIPDPYLIDPDFPCICLALRVNHDFRLNPLS